MAITGQPKTFYSSRNFRVLIPGVGSADFSKMDWAGLEAEVAEHYEGASVVPASQFVGKQKVNPATLERGVTDSTDLYDWFLLCSNAAATRGLNEEKYKREVTVQQLDHEGVPKFGWVFHEAFAPKFEPTSGGFDSEGGKHAIERVTIHYKWAERITF